MASAEATSTTVLSALLSKSVSPSTKAQSMNQTTTPASISRPIQVIGARLLINSASGNFDLLERDILLLISSVGAGIPRPGASIADEGGEYPPLRGLCSIRFNLELRIERVNHRPMLILDEFAAHLERGGEFP